MENETWAGISVLSPTIHATLGQSDLCRVGVPISALSRQQVSMQLEYANKIEKGLCKLSSAIQMLLGSQHVRCSVLRIWVFDKVWVRAALLSLNT